MEIEKDFISLLLIALLALSVPVFATRLKPVRLPIVVGEIFAGIIIGKSGFNLVHSTPVIEFLAQFGFAFLMFLSGLEMNFEELRGGMRGKNGETFIKQPISLAGISFLFTVILSISIGFVFSGIGLTRNGLLMGLILSTTSLGIVVPVLKERRMTMTPYGQVLLVTALIGDFVTLFLLSISIAFLSKGPSVELFLILILGFVFAAAVKIVQQVKRIPVLSRTVEELSHATAQIRIRGVFALILFWVVLSEKLGLEIILGAFLAGVIVSLLRPGDESVLREKLDAIGYGFFIPIFFITVGTGFDLRALLVSKSALVLVPAFIFAAYLVKLLPSLVFKSLFSWRQTLAAGFLLSSRLSLIIAASEIALDLDIITDATYSAMVLVAVVTCTASPLIFSKLSGMPMKSRREGIIIVGTDHLALTVGERFRRTGATITFISIDQCQLPRLQRLQFKCVVYDADPLQTLRNAGASTANAVIVIIDDPPICLEICRVARMQFHVPRIIARTENARLIDSLSGLQVSIVKPSIATALALEGALLFPVSFDMLMDPESGIEMMDVFMENKRYAKKKIQEIPLPGNVRLVGIKRNDESLVPGQESVLLMHDMLMLLGTRVNLLKAQNMFQGENSEKNPGIS